VCALHKILFQSHNQAGSDGQGNLYESSNGKPEGTRPFGRLVVDGNAILKRVLKNEL